MKDKKITWQENVGEEELYFSQDYAHTENSPYFLLNLDENLSIYYANQEFYHVFETNSETFAQLYQNRFVYTLTYQEQIEQKKALPIFSDNISGHQTKMEIITASGGTKSLFFHFQKEKIGAAGEKLCGRLLSLAECLDYKKNQQCLLQN